ncbi:MAG TPA: aminopeptidase P N-terminal domain-containing protein [Polyangiaceae bacterium]|jgi:Xaa-Pro aminopeptidase
MCECDQVLFARRRAAFAEAMARGTQAGQGEAVAVLPSAPVFPRNGDVDHDYRQDSDLFWLTGFDEPGSALVLTANDKKATFFVRPRDPDREIWDGPRAGVDGVKARFGADESHLIRELDEELPKLLANKRRLYYRLGRDRAFDDQLLRALDRTRAKGRSGISWPTEIIDPAELLHEMRLFKDEADLAAMKRAAAITKEAHLRAMAHARGGMNEYEVEALLLETFRKHGSERAAYRSIVGAGANGTILHYVANNRPIGDNDLLLIDAGCEYGYFASDVTRTFPVSGKFTREQQAIYEIVLESQTEGIARSRAGATVDEIHKACVEVITRGLVRIGLLQGEVEKLIETEAYKPFYMHRTSHWLGMDVHDVGRYYIDGKSRQLAAGMVLTVEPGIYIGREYDKVAPEWRGIGVRIEDDILVTDGAPVNLTEGIPKTVGELERACAA